MGSRRKTGVEGVRLPKLSRRAVIAGTSVAPFGAANPAAGLTTAPTAALTATHEGTERCAHWLAINTEIERLQTRWAKLESWLAKKHDWLRLSLEEQQALPGAKKLRDIDVCLDMLFVKREALLDSLPTSGSASLESVIARLAVVERLIWPEEHPEVHALIAGSRQDLIAMSQGHPNAVGRDPAA